MCHSASVRAILVATAMSACIAASSTHAEDTQPIPETKDFRSNSLFHFTISPDGRWLVFFKRTAPEEKATRHRTLGNLRVIDLSSGELHSITLSGEDAPNGLRDGDASWSTDSKLCALPPPQLAQWDSEKGILIDLRDAANIRVVSTTVHYRDQPRIEVAGEQFQMPERFTCSDCWPAQNDVELMKKHVDGQYLKWSGVPVNPNAYAEQIVSPDGSKIYFQKGAQTEEVALIELDIASGTERELAAFRGECARIERLRPSPDGRQLAFQFKTGCDFVGPPDVCVLDLASKQYKVIGKSDGGTMHWTSTSDRLFYYREDHLWVANFGPPAPAPAPAPPTPPTTAPATHPSKT